MAIVTLAQVVGLAILIALIVAICVIAVRRSVLARSGGIDMCWRTDLTPGGRGWVLGQGRFHGSDLRLYRSFSPLPIASRVLDREDWPSATAATRSAPSPTCCRRTR